jgi:A/G-specific adenine glycosylase
MHCVPVFPDVSALEAFVATLGDSPQLTQHELPPFLHVLTHRELHLHPVAIRSMQLNRPPGEGEWLSPDQWDRVGLPSPIRKLLDVTQASL